jgi:hypothetical protein
MRTASFVFCAASLLAVFSLVSIYFQDRLLHLHSSVLASKGIVPSHDIHEMNQQDYHQYQRHPKINSPKPKPPQRFFASTTAEVSVSECSPYQIASIIHGQTNVQSPFKQNARIMFGYNPFIIEGSLTPKPSLL